MALLHQFESIIWTAAMVDVDKYELPLSTDSGQAAASYREGVASMLAGWPGAAEQLDAAIAADPEFALAYAARARLHATHAQAAEAAACIAVAQQKLLVRGDAREASHVQVLALAISGRQQQALDAALAHSDRWPTDRVILSLPLGAFGLFAFSGMADHDQARVDLCARYASRFSYDDWWFLTSYGWALAENGDVSRGRAMLERAFALRRDNANTVHALTHAMFESGAGAETQTLIADWLPDYDRSGILHGHIAWHQALIALEHGDTETALSIYTDLVRPAVSQGTPINIVSDSASLLWRLKIYGYPTPDDLWQEAASYARQAYPLPAHSNFIDPHMALIEAATGQTERLDQRIRALEGRVAEGTLSAGAVVPAIARAAAAIAEEDFAVAVRVLEPVAMEAVRIGGSGAQREVVEDTLLVALMRSGETARARALLDRRLHRRPSPRDAAWRSELTQ